MFLTLIARVYASGQIEGTSKIFYSSTTHNLPKEIRRSFMYRRTNQEVRDSRCDGGGGLKESTQTSRTLYGISTPRKPANKTLPEHIDHLFPLRPRAAPSLTRNCIVKVFFSFFHSLSLLSRFILSFSVRPPSSCSHYPGPTASLSAASYIFPFFSRVLKEHAHPLDYIRKY